MNYTNIISPLDQFEVRDLISIKAPILFNANFSLTNIGLYITLAAIVATTLNIYGSSNKLVFNN
jgi:F-type H+-transporting ATPase subunit a